MKLKQSIVSSVIVASVLVGGALTSGSVMAQEAAAKTEAKAKKHVPAAQKNRKTRAIGARVGKKVQAAYELYSADQADEALAILVDIDASAEYDRAYLDRFIGNLYAGMEGKSDLAIKYLKDAIKPDVLNFTDHAQSMRLIGDLQMQNKKYVEAEKSYLAWMAFTEKQEADIYVRIAQARYETKNLDGVIEMADKAISLYDEPNRNPYILKLSSYYERKMYPDAVKIAETLVLLFPTEKRWWSQLGMFYMLVEDYERALSTMELVYKQGFIEKESEAKALSQLYATNNIPWKSALIQEEYLKSGLLKREESTLKAIANSWHSAMEFEKAAEYYGEAAAIANDPELYRKQGTLLLQSENYRQAVAPLKKALDLGVKREGRVHMSLAEAYFYQEKYKDAYKHVRAALDDPQSKRVARGWLSYVKDTAARRGQSI